MIILDTDVLSIIQRADGPQYENLVRRLDAADEDVAVSIISFEEQMRGWLAFIARSTSLDHQVKGYARLHGLLEDFTSRPVIDFDQSCAARFQGLISIGAYSCYFVVRAHKKHFALCTSMRYTYQV